jgi:hypothetical protein
MNTPTFNSEIEKLRNLTASSYLEAVVLYCETNKIDVTFIAKSLSTEIKELILSEAKEKNLVKK